MFNFFYKHAHSFYLYSHLYNDILKTQKKVDIATIKQYLSENHPNPYKITMQKYGEYLYLITVKFKTKAQQTDFLTYLQQDKEPFPPWKVFPNIFHGGPRWNQGVEYDYALFHWQPYWKSLTPTEKEKYQDKYNCPLEWKEWLQDHDAHL